MASLQTPPAENKPESGPELGMTPSNDSKVNNQAEAKPVAPIKAELNPEPEQPDPVAVPVAQPPNPIPVQVSPTKSQPSGSIAMMPVMPGSVLMQGAAIMSPVFVPGGVVPEGTVPYFIPAVPQIQVPSANMDIKLGPSTSTVSSTPGPSPNVIVPPPIAVQTPVKPAEAVKFNESNRTSLASANTSTAADTKLQKDSAARKRKSGPRLQRPSVIKHTRTVPKEIMNPAPAPRPYMPKSVYGSPYSGIGALPHRNPPSSTCLQYVASTSSHEFSTWCTATACS